MISSPKENSVTSGNLVYIRRLNSGTTSSSAWRTFISVCVGSLNMHSLCFWRQNRYILNILVPGFYDQYYYRIYQNRSIIYIILRTECIKKFNSLHYRWLCLSCNHWSFKLCCLGYLKFMFENYFPVESAVLHEIQIT